MNARFRNFAQAIVDYLNGTTTPADNINFYLTCGDVTFTSGNVDNISLVAFIDDAFPGVNSVNEIVSISVHGRYRRPNELRRMNQELNMILFNHKRS